MYGFGKVIISKPYPNKKPKKSYVEYMYKAYSDTELCLQYMMKPASNLAHEDDLLKNHKRLISNGGNPKKTKKLRSV